MNKQTDVNCTCDVVEHCDNAKAYDLKVVHFPLTKVNYQRCKMTMPFGFICDVNLRLKM